MQTAVGETTYPVMAMIKWDRVYDSMLATPLQVRDIVARALAFVAFRVATTCAVFMLVVAPFGVFATWWGCCWRSRRRCWWAWRSGRWSMRSRPG